jgi:peptidyl-dipeptidase Dcp
MANPFLIEWNTPFGAPPFEKIKVNDYIPAIKKAITTARKEIKSIIDDVKPPDFANTIGPYERSGSFLGRIIPVLFNLNSAETSKELQAVAREVSPLLTRFSNDITLNKKLFNRISAVYHNRDKQGLSVEQIRLTEKKYRNFIQGGAGLPAGPRKRFREISEELATLTIRFEENVLEETNSFEFHTPELTDLQGLPGNLIETAAMEARSRGKEGWVFTLHFPSYVPFMQYSERRDLREKLFRAYSSRGCRGNNNDNRELVIKIVNLRLELAKILGYPNYAAMGLVDNMADSQAIVEKFLNELFNASVKAAGRDFSQVSSFAYENGHSGQLERWDWPFYSEKLKKKIFSINDEILRPYFRLEKAENAILRLATTLYGIRFVELDTVPVYHPDVKTFGVYDQDDSFLGLFYADYHPRTGKSGGAWMTSYREQSLTDGMEVRPLISIVANFTRPGETTPSLLSFNELTTFLHEFGHSLHGLLTRCTYEALSGTSVSRDFVELPSQLMENFAYEKEWLDTWAEHYETGEKIPAEMIEKIRASATYMEGYACLRQLGFAFLDMAWHSVTEPVTDPVPEFEIRSTMKTELFPLVEGSVVSTAFNHIFPGGYAAGYYGYKWAEVLDADAFSLFTETGIFNRKTAESFRKNILEKGGTDKPMDLYIRFRGKEPSLDALLKRSGLINRD